MVGEVKNMHDAFPYYRASVRLSDGHGLGKTSGAIMLALDSLFQCKRPVCTGVP
jgi:hypothetical protein